MPRRGAAKTGQPPFPGGTGESRVNPSHSQLSQLVFTEKITFLFPTHSEPEILQRKARDCSWTFLCRDLVGHPHPEVAPSPPCWPHVLCPATLRPASGQRDVTAVFTGGGVGGGEVADFVQIGRVSFPPLSVTPDPWPGGTPTPQIVINLHLLICRGNANFFFLLQNYLLKKKKETTKNRDAGCSLNVPH